MVSKYDPSILVFLLGAKYDLKGSVIVNDEDANDLVEIYELKEYYKTSLKTRYKVFELLAELLVEYKD